MAWTPYVAPKPATKPERTPVQDFFGRTPEAAEALVPVSMPKVPGLDPAIKSQADLAELLRGQRETDLSAYRTAFASAPTAAWNEQETADISKIFEPGGYEAALSAIRGRRQTSMSNLSDTLLGDLKRTLGLATVGRGPTGLGSYLTRTAGTAAAKLRAQESADQAAQERADLGALMAARAAMQGRRQTLTDSNLSRLLQPSQAEATSLGQYQSAIAQLLQQALANSTLSYGQAA